MSEIKLLLVHTHTHTHVDTKMVGGGLLAHRCLRVRTQSLAGQSHSYEKRVIIQNKDTVPVDVLQ